MIKKLSFLMTLAIFTFACNNAPAPEENADPNAPQTFGEKISTDGALTYTDLLTKMNGDEKITAKVRGEVTGVCQVKGCWMKIKPEAEGQPEMFVKFKDYGFFMPKDISGREVIMEGYAFIETTSVDELKHYAEDEGRSKEEIEGITEPEQQYKFMASGVLLLPAN